MQSRPGNIHFALALAALFTALLFHVPLPAQAQTPRLVRPDFNLDLAPAGTIAASPAVAQNADGRIGHVWLDNRPGFSDVWFRLDANGVTRNATLTFSAETIGTTAAKSPAATFDSDGNFVACWTVDPVQEHTGVFDVMANWFGPNGTSRFANGDAIFINQEFIDPEGRVSAKSPAVAANANRQTLFVWSDNRSFIDSGNTRIFFHDVWAARLLNREFTDEADFPINSQFTTRLGARHPRVAATPSNSYAIVWDEDRFLLPGDDDELRQDIFLRLLPGDYVVTDATQFGETMVTLNDAGSDNATYPDVAVAPGGRILVVWQNEAQFQGSPDPGDIRCRLFAANGTPISDNEITVNQDAAANLQQRPRVTALADGNFLIAWIDARNNGSLYGRVFNPATASFTTNEFRIDDSPGEVRTAAVAADRLHNFTAAWGERTGTQQNPIDAVFANIHSFAPEGDLNGDLEVTGHDLLIFSAHWHPATAAVDLDYDVNPYADFNNDDRVDAADAIILHDRLQAQPAPGKAAAEIIWTKPTENPPAAAPPVLTPRRTSTTAASGARR